mgnify:CR=1 FL=1
MRLLLVGTWVLQAEAISFGNWYEASSDEEGVSCAYGDSGPGTAGFYFGANLALSVEGAGKLKPSDVVLTAGTYDAFGTPTILSELEMWKEFGEPAQRYFNQKPNALEWDEDGNWANWEAYEDDDDLLYVVSSRIWPKWNPRNNTNWSPADTGRQWILIPLKPADGGASFRHTFSVSPMRTKVNRLNRFGDFRFPAPLAWCMSLSYSQCRAAVDGFVARLHSIIHPAGVQPS